MKSRSKPLEHDRGPPKLQYAALTICPVDSGAVIGAVLKAAGDTEHKIDGELDVDALFATRFGRPISRVSKRPRDRRDVLLRVPRSDLSAGRPIATRVAVRFG